MANKTPEFDALIIQLGDAIYWLISEYERLDRVGMKTTDNQVKAHSEVLTDDIQDRIQDLECAIAALPASSLEAAAIQMRMLEAMNALDDDGRGRCKKRLHYSILNVLETNKSDPNAKWGDDWYMPRHSSPFHHRSRVNGHVRG